MKKRELSKKITILLLCLIVVGCKTTNREMSWEEVKRVSVQVHAEDNGFYKKINTSCICGGLHHEVNVLEFDKPCYVCGQTAPAMEYHQECFSKMR